MAGRSEANAPSSSSGAAEPYSIFDHRQKALITFLAATAATFSASASNIYFPALPAIAHDLDVSIELVSLTVTSYLIFQGIAPSIWGPLSDVKGRRITYFCTLLVFFVACIGLAETRNYATLVVLRALQSSGSASTVAVGSAVIGDITTPAERGSYLGIFQAGLLAPVAVGPVIGGALAASLGWRSIFWFLAIYSGIYLTAQAFLLPETLRSLVGNGSAVSSNPVTRFPLNIYQKLTKVKFNHQDQPQGPKKLKIDISAPIRILFSKQAICPIIFLALYYAIWQMSITAMSVLFSERYGLSTTQIGLTYIANGAGTVSGTLVTGWMLDKEYERVKKQYEADKSQNGLELGSQDSPTVQDDDVDFPLEKARFRLAPIFALLQCASIITFGWTIEYRVHIAVPIITTFFTGWTVISIASIVTTYLLDVFSEQKAASTASLNLARCLLAAGGTSIVMPIISAVGVGFAFTIAIAVQILALGGVAIQWKYGGGWRLDAEKARRQAEQEDGTASVSSIDQRETAL
ncbi:MFS general substrate transporter [Nemania sp. FL0916]|nr:MFS general substrate transporter [Nemania sp. FL0916]